LASWKHNPCQTERLGKYSATIHLSFKDDMRNQDIMTALRFVAKIIKNCLFVCLFVFFFEFANYYQPQLNLYPEYTSLQYVQETHEVLLKIRLKRFLRTTSYAHPRKCVTYMRVIQVDLQDKAKQILFDLCPNIRGFLNNSKHLHITTSGLRTAGWKLAHKAPYIY